MVEKGEVVPSKELEPQKGAKIAKGAQTRSSSVGAIMERGHDHYPRVQIWDPFLVLDGAPSPRLLHKGLQAREGRLCG